MRNALLIALAVYAAACATTPAPMPAPHTDSARGTRHSALSTDLKDALAAIETRDARPFVPPHVDIEAAQSIAIPQHPSVDKAVRLFAGQLKPSVQESLIRSAKYKRLIDRVLDEYKLPKALAYLPVIESAYLPSLTSRAGARGVWQFMPDTAREYGLRVDWWVDERADPERATRAAAAYLQDLYRRFNDWSLALAAYNAGPGRIERALSKSGSSTFWDLLERTAIPAETRGYVPTFFATVAIVTDPATYGFQLVEPVDGDTRRVDVDGPVSLRYIAEVANVDVRTLRELNPGLRRSALPPGRSAVVLPSNAAPPVVARADSMRYDDVNLTISSFTLRSGDTLRRLALSIGTDVDTLLAMNHLRSPAVVGEGDSIYLPVRAREVGALLSDENYYAVRKGDTMFSIARRFNLSVSELRELNELSRSYKLRTGEKLRVVVPRALIAGSG